jgi:hypothetical protein
LEKLIPVSNSVHSVSQQLRCLCQVVKSELSSSGSRLQRHQQTRRRGWRCSARFSSDPRTLTLGVCPFTGTSGLQPFSWINENNLPFIT